MGTSNSANDTAPSRRWKAIVLDADLGADLRAIYVGATGNVAMVGSDGASEVFTGIVGGVEHPLRPRKILSVGTTATGLIGLY